MRFAKLSMIVFVLLSVVALQLQAQTESSPDDVQAIRRELESLRKSQEAMQKDLQEIKALLRSRTAGAPKPALADMKVSLEGEPVRGSSTASVVLVEYSDYQCPFCQRVATETMPRIYDAYVATGKVRHVFKDLPLESIHPNAFRAAVAAACAAEQGKFWELNHKLFQNGKQLGADRLPQYADEVGLEREKFTQCLGSGRFDAEIRADVREAGADGISGTPAFLIGTVDAKGRVSVVKSLAGAQSLAAFEAALDEVLARKE